MWTTTSREDNLDGQLTMLEAQRVIDSIVDHWQVRVEGVMRELLLLIWLLMV
jgi:hypothetical protein